MNAILQVKDLHVRFKKKHTAVCGINFSLEEGEILAIVGETGSGKSATAKAITKLFPLHGVEVEGQVLFQEKNLLEYKEKELRKIRGKEIGMIFQDPSSSLNPTLPIGVQIIENCKKANPTLSYQAHLKEAISLLEWVGIRSAAKRIMDYPFTLSGGMKQRVMIAMALAAKPKILIADEPTTALDVTIQAQILEILKSIRKSFQMSIILITHDLGVVSGFCDNALVMQEGKIVEKGSLEEIFYFPKHPFTQELLHHKKELPFSIDTKATPSIPLIQITDLSKVFFSKNIPFKVLNNINLDLYEGETLGIIGESGCGKSTLGKILMELELPTEGKVLFSKNFTQRQKQIGAIFQDPSGSLNPKMTIFEIIKEPFSIHKVPYSVEKILDLLSQVHLPPSFLTRFPHELSGGQKQRVAIARALALDPKFLVCDEPTSALDQTTLSQILSLLKELQIKKNLTLLLISHDLRAVRKIASRGCVMYLGEIMELTTTEELYKTPLHPYTQALISSIPLLDPKEEKTRKKLLLQGELSHTSSCNGCAFVSRCPKAQSICHQQKPNLEEVRSGHFVKCHFPYN